MTSSNDTMVPDIPIATISGADFGAKHLQHAVSHPPDSILFPFLHGLEGENHAQNTFFASSSFAGVSGTSPAAGIRRYPDPCDSPRMLPPPPVPTYRGLVWVVCEDDLRAAGDTVTLSILRRRLMPQAPGEPISTSSSDDDYDDVDDDDDDDDDFMDDEEEELELEGPDVMDEKMEVDVDVLRSFQKELGLKDAPAVTDELDEDEQAMHRMVLHAIEQGEEERASVEATRSTDNHKAVLNMGHESSPTSSASPSPPPSVMSPSSSQSSVLPPLSPSSSSIITTSNVEGKSSNPSSPVSPTSPSSFLLLTPEIAADSQGDHIRIISPGDSADFPEGGSILDDTMPAIGDRQVKENLHYQGAHMHPVAHRPAAPTTVSVESCDNKPRRLSIHTDLPLEANPTPTPSDIGLCIPDVKEGPIDRPHDIDTPYDEMKGSNAGKSRNIKPSLAHSTDPSAPPLLTSTFRPRELIRRVHKTKRRASESKNAAHSGKEVPVDESQSDVKIDTDDGWEFVPARVPDGISLRNFGIQVPIYATLSDIAIYSPYGATPAAMTLAKRFQSAIRAKRNERLRMRRHFNAALGQQESPELANLEAGLPIYNVYVLDASEKELRKEVPHLMMRICGAGVPGDPTDGVHTDGSNGHVVEQNYGDKPMQPSSQDDMDIDSPKLREPHQTIASLVEDEDIPIAPNTVNFAIRERDEMRDLTKASEIATLCVTPTIGLPSSPSQDISLAGNSVMSNEAFDCTKPSSASWDPRCGQVYLGNSLDVPLVQDHAGLGQFKHASSITSDPDELARWDWHSLTRHLRNVEGLLSEYDAAIDEKLDGPPPSAADMETRMQPLEDDVFNYSATNDPAEGFGYDICVECHDLAPFPNSAHLRAAEEHLGMLDTLWREKWEKAWYAREERREKMEELEVHPSSGNPEQQNPDQARRSAAPVPPPLTPPRPPPHANSVIHLPFPSSPQNTQTTLLALLPVIRFLEQWVRPVQSPSIPKNAPAENTSPSSIEQVRSGSSGTRRWSSVTSLLPSFASFPGTGSKPQSAASSPQPSSGVPPHPSRSRAMTSPSSQQGLNALTPLQARTRPLKILMYSSDGYTESSVPALCLLMAIKGIMLPEAYLELQVEKRRSFFVYQSDLGILRRVEARLREEREREREKEREREREREKLTSDAYMTSAAAAINANGKRIALPAPPSANRSASVVAATSPQSPYSGRHGSFMGRPAAKSVSFTQPPPQFPPPQKPQEIQPIDIFPSKPAAVVSPFEFGSLPTHPPSHPPAFSSSGTIQHPLNVGTISIPPQQQATGMSMVKGRPRANTSPWLPSLFGGDHQSWFNDPRFDGSFPSRVLPFLYLGNLNHASNVYMLHALGITHVVSVGECALIPPPHHMSSHNSGNAHYRPSPGAHFIPGKGPAGQGCLWIEEREGRIKVLDIKGVCDDGIDTLEPQLEPICDWIDKAREEGGQVLVHCRVGVSRSATVTIAYVMKHLGLPLVDAYLIVRSRRLSVLIQPNMRLLYNLCGWEIKLAKERANGDERKLKSELARTLTWPYLAKEVHALNKKYIH